jgi:hypothetical protein
MDVWNIPVGTDSDENLPILNKIKHPKEGEKKEHNGRTQVGNQKNSPKRVDH